MTDKAAFVQQIYQAGLDAGLTDAAARVRAAQAALESDYGNNAIGYNYFGITAGPNWTGATVQRGDKDSAGNPISQQFRVYQSREAGLLDAFSMMDDAFPAFNSAPDVPSALAALRTGVRGTYYGGSQKSYETTVKNIDAKYLPAASSGAAPAAAPAVSTSTVDFLNTRGTSKGGYVGVNADKLSVEFSLRMEALITAAEQQTGAKVTINEGFRPPERQAQYYSNYKYSLNLKKGMDDATAKAKAAVTYDGKTYTPLWAGGVAAPPGQSKHQSGMAMDIDEGPARTWMAQHAAEFGIEWGGGWGGGQSDPPHFQIPQDEVAALHKGVPLRTMGQTALDAVAAGIGLPPGDIPDTAVATALDVTARAPTPFPAPRWRSNAEKLDAINASVKARELLEASSAIYGVRRDPGAPASAIPAMTPDQTYAGQLRSIPISNDDYFRLLTPSSSGGRDPIGPGPTSWFLDESDAAPGGVGSLGFTTAGAVFTGTARDIQTARDDHPATPGVPMAAPQPGTPETGFDTVLDPRQEARFQQWKAIVAPQDSGADYDFRGAFAAGINPDPKTGHWPDTFKKPTEPTFSVESQYAKYAPALAGRWDGDTYVPPALSLEDRDALFAARVGARAPVPMPGRPYFQMTAPVPMPGRPGAIDLKPLAGTVITSSRPLTKAEIHARLMAQQSPDPARTPTDKTIVGGFVKRAKDQAAAAVKEQSDKIAAAAALEADAVRSSALNQVSTVIPAAQSVGTQLGTAFNSLGQLFGGKPQVVPPTPSWKTSVLRALTPKSPVTITPAAISPETVHPQYAPVASAPTMPKAIAQAPVVITAAETRAEQATARKAQPIETSLSGVDPRGGDIPETKSRPAQLAPIYTAPIKSVPSTKPQQRIEKHQVLNPDYAAWEKQQAVNAVAVGKLEDIHDRNDAATMNAQSSAPAAPPPPRYITQTRVVPVRPGNQEVTGTVAGVGGIARGVTLKEAVANGDIVVQRPSSIPKSQRSGRVPSQSNAVAQAVQSVRIASGKEVAVGATGTAQGGRYSYQVQADGSIAKTINPTTPAIAAQRAADMASVTGAKGFPGSGRY